MDVKSHVRSASENNAAWCAAVWQAHGLTAHRRGGLWFCTDETPEFYPNAVTVDQTANPDLHAFIRKLAAAARFEFSVKDSFANLALSGVGFRELFSATWFWCDPTEMIPDHGALEWTKIGESQLEAWEEAWRGGPAEQRIFPRSLLDDPRVFVVGGLNTRGLIVAGAIGYEAAGVIGVTNAFGARQEIIDVMASMVGHLPVVSYGRDVDQAKSRGFVALAPLRVWTSGGRSRA